MFRKLRSDKTVIAIASLLIAYCIWLIAKMGNVEEQVLDNVPLVVSLPPYVETEVSRKTVNVEVRYPKSLRSRIYSSAFRVVINDTSLVQQAGVREMQTVRVPLTADDVQHSSLTANAQVQRVEPASVNLGIKFRTVPARVIPQLIGQPMAGYRVEKIIVTPPDRLLTGAPDRLEHLPRNPAGEVELLTAPISVTDRRDIPTTSVALLVPEGVSIINEETRQRLSREMSTAVVQIIIREEASSRTIAAVPVQVATLTRNLVARTEPTSATVVITGPRSLVESLDPRTILLRPKNPPVEKPGEIGSIEIEARLDESAPPSVRVVSVQPQTVLLRYDLLPGDVLTTPTVSPPNE